MKLFRITPERFLKESYEGLARRFGKRFYHEYLPYKNWKRKADKQKVAGMVKTLRGGGTLPLIVFGRDYQEGRHRALAYKGVGKKRISVVLKC